MLTFAECEQLVSRARDKRSKPIANNTRVEKRDDDTYALRLHATDIAVFHRDGRTELFSGGWRTVTTADRLRNYVGARIQSEQGTWYVTAEPVATDPRPEPAWREVPKPFHALDPGPEPVKPADGCIAGETRDVEQDWYGETRTKTVTYGEESYRWDVSGYEQCPHCKLFYQQHRAWHEAMHGGGWGRNRTHGYAKMVELLDKYGSREAWQEAYIADFRAVREQRKLYREWVDRNRVPFEEGVEINANGYAKRPNPRKIKQAQARARKIEQMKKRINEFVAEAVDEWATNGLPFPSGGDCWGCFMRTGDGRVEPFGNDHLEQHIEERYYVPSMFVNALRNAGYRDPAIGLYLEMDFETQRMGGVTPPNGHRMGTDTITRALRRYLYERLIPELSAGTVEPELSTH